MDFRKDYKVDANPPSWTRSGTGTSSRPPTYIYIESKSHRMTMKNARACSKEMPRPESTYKVGVRERWRSGSLGSRVLPLLPALQAADRPTCMKIMRSIQTIQNYVLGLPILMSNPPQLHQIPCLCAQCPCLTQSLGSKTMYLAPSNSCRAPPVSIEPHPFVHNALA